MGNRPVGMKKGIKSVDEYTRYKNEDYILQVKLYRVKYRFLREFDRNKNCSIEEAYEIAKKIASRFHFIWGIYSFTEFFKENYRK